MHLYDKPAYLKSKYQLLRQLNRECFQVDPEKYCREQIDYDPNYELGVDGEEYVMGKFIKGIRYLNRTYKLKLPQFPSYDEMYKLNFRLPAKIDFAVKYMVATTHLKTQYVSHNIAFTYAVSDTNERLVIHYPRQTQDMIDYARFIIANGYREYVRS